MYAIIECGGKQYRVQEGDLIRVEKLAVEVGSNFTTDKVLMIGGDNKTIVGTPYVPGYVVTGKILNHDKDKKVLVFHYKAKKNIRTRYGHRQPFTSLLIEEIQKGKVEPVETKSEKAVVKTAKVDAEPEKKETKTTVKAASAEAEVAKTTKATSTTKAKAATTETATKSVKTAKPKVESAKTASAAKPATAKAVKTAKAETAATKTAKTATKANTTKAKAAKTEKTEA